MSSRIDASKWGKRRELISKQQRSGLSVAAFCHKHGLSESNFYAWKRKLGEQAVGPQCPTVSRSPASAGKRQSNAQPLGAFVQLPLPASRSEGVAAWVEIALTDGVLIRLPASNAPLIQVVLGELLIKLREVSHV